MTCDRQTDRRTDRGVVGCLHRALHGARLGPLLSSPRHRETRARPNSDAGDPAVGLNLTLNHAPYRRINNSFFTNFDFLFLFSDIIICWPILWRHSGPLCHALSLSLLLSWTSMRRRRATVATPGKWQCKIRACGTSGEWAQHFSNASCCFICCFYYMFFFNFWLCEKR